MDRSAGPADFDFSRWPELDEQLPATLSPAEAGILAWHLAEQLVGWFGVEQFEAYRGKEGVQVHNVDEFAAVLTAKLGPVLELLPSGTLERLHSEGSIARPLVHPWDKTS